MTRTKAVDTSIHAVSPVFMFLKAETFFGRPGKKRLKITTMISSIKGMIAYRFVMDIG